MREDAAAGAASSRRFWLASGHCAAQSATLHTVIHSVLEEEPRELRSRCAIAVAPSHTVRLQPSCTVGEMSRSEPLLSASEQAAMAKNEPLLTATEQAACSCKAGSCPRKSDNCGDFLRRSHPDFSGPRSSLEYCVSEFR